MWDISKCEECEISCQRGRLCPYSGGVGEPILDWAESLLPVLTQDFLRIVSAVPLTEQGYSLQMMSDYMLSVGTPVEPKLFWDIMVTFLNWKNKRFYKEAEKARNNNKK